MAFAVAAEGNVSAMNGIGSLDDGLIDPQIQAFPEKRLKDFADVGADQRFIGCEAGMSSMGSPVIAPEAFAAELIRRFPVDVENTLFHILVKASEIVPGNDDSEIGDAFLLEQMCCLGRLIFPQFKTKDIRFATAMLRWLRRMQTST